VLINIPPVLINIPGILNGIDTDFPKNISGLLIWKSGYK